MTEMYVDDIIAVCLNKDLALDLITAKRVYTRLPGPTAVVDVGHTIGVCHFGVCH